MMKRLLISVLAAVSLCPVAEAQLKMISDQVRDSIAAPPLSPASGALKFGRTHIVAEDMREDSAPAEYRYEFLNVSDEAVVISRVTTTCSCVVADPDRKVIPAGEGGCVNVKYNPKGHPGRFDRRIFVYADGDSRPAAVLRLSVNVVDEAADRERFPYQLGCIRVDSRDVVFKGDGVKHLHFVNLSGRSLKLEYDEMMLPGCVEVSVYPKVVENGNEGVIRISYDSSRRRPPSGRAVVMLKGLGVPPSQSSVNLHFNDR